MAALKVPGVHRERKTVASQICDRRGYYHGRGSLYGGKSEQSKRIAVRGLKPVVISAANGNHFKNGGKVTCVEKAFAMITDGADVLDAVIAGVNILELDPEETSVGYGGLPNADGVVQLDSSVMHGPKKRAARSRRSRACERRRWWPRR